MKSRFKLKNFCILIIIWLIPPLLPQLVFYNWFPTGFMEIIPFCSSCRAITSVSISKTLPFSSVLPAGSSTPNILNPIVSSHEQDSAFNDLSRFFPIVNIPATLVRYNLSVKNNISIDTSYSDINNPGTSRRSILQSVLLCSGKSINFGREAILLSGLYFGDRTNDDRDRAKEIIADCIDNPTISSLNNTGQTLLLQDVKLSTSSTISFMVVPDPKSQILMFVGWYIVWFGFLILLREGPLRVFKR